MKATWKVLKTLGYLELFSNLDSWNTFPTTRDSQKSEGPSRLLSAGIRRTDFSGKIEAVAAREQHYRIGRLYPRLLAKASCRMGPSLQDIVKVFLVEGFWEDTR